MIVAILTKSVVFVRDYETEWFFDKQVDLESQFFV